MKNEEGFPRSVTFDKEDQDAIPKHIREKMDADRKRAEVQMMEDGFEAIRISLPKGVSAKLKPKKDSDVSFFEFKSQDYIDDHQYNALINAIKFYFKFTEVYHDRTDFRVFITDEDHHTFKMYAAYGIVANGILYKPNGCLLESHHLLNGCGKCAKGNHLRCGWH